MEFDFCRTDYVLSLASYQHTGASVSKVNTRTLAHIALPAVIVSPCLLNLNMQGQ